MLRFFSASTGIVNSGKAMAESLAHALEGQDSLDCDLLLFHSTIGHDFEELLSEAKRLAPSATVVGCTGAGVIGTEGANEAMRALGIMAIKSDGDNEFSVTYCDSIRNHNSYEKSVEMARDLKAQNPNINMLMILASGIDIAADKAIEGIESVFGEGTPIFGGTSSDNKRALTSFQFLNEEILERAVVLLGFADPTLEIEMGVHHGSVPIGIPFTVTRSEENRVLELDGKPAWPFLMDKLGLPQETHPGATIPIAGLSELLPEEFHTEYDNRVILRAIVKVDEAHESFYLPVACPAGTELWLTRRDEELIFSGLERMVNKLKCKLAGRKPVAVFHTDCVARGRTLFSRLLKDEIVSRTQFPLMGDNEVPWLGMYGFGEFTLLGGRNCFHNYTSSIYVLVRK